MRAFHEPYVERGDISGIASFLDRTMIRHKIPDIVLPPLTRSIAELEFNELEKMTYNVLLALFASNAIQSERTDVSVLLKPRLRCMLTWWHYRRITFFTASISVHRNASDLLTLSYSSTESSPEFAYQQFGSSSSALLVARAGESHHVDLDIKC
jgi:hypothetical protein